MQTYDIGFNSSRADRRHNTGRQAVGVLDPVDGDGRLVGGPTANGDEVGLLIVVLPGLGDTVILRRNLENLSLACRATDVGLSGDWKGDVSVLGRVLGGGTHEWRE